MDGSFAFTVLVVQHSKVVFCLRKYVKCEIVVILSDRVVKRVCTSAISSIESRTIRVHLQQDAEPVKVLRLAVRYLSPPSDHIDEGGAHVSMVAVFERVLQRLVRWLWVQVIQVSSV